MLYYNQRKNQNKEVKMFINNVPQYQAGYGYSNFQNNMNQYQSGYGYTCQNCGFNNQFSTINWSEGWQKPEVDYWNNKSIYDYNMKNTY